MLDLNLQFFGGRGSNSGLSFSIPNGGGDNFDPYSLGERTPETLKDALGSQGKGKSVADALAKTNPNYSRAYSEFSENCQRCVVAYELRRRGYDVEAQPTYKGDAWPQVHVVNGQRLGRWRGAFRHAVTDKVGVRGNNAKAEAKVLSNIASKMREYGNGARAVVNIGYRGVGTGHVFSVENVGGRIQYVDAQSGQRYNAQSMKNLMHIVDTSTVGLTRTDNLRVSTRTKEFVWQRTRNNK